MIGKDALYELYWKEGLSTNQIGEKFNVHNRTVLRWMTKYGISRRGLSESKFTVKLSKEELEELYIRKGLSTNKIAEFLKIKDTEYVRRKLIFYGIERRNSIEVRKIKIDFRPSPEMAYILGVMKGDGSICGKYSVQLGTVEKDFAKSFHDALCSIGFNSNMSEYAPKKERRKAVHFVRGGSKNFIDWMKKLGEKDIMEIALKNRENSKEFLRGFYESEGCISGGVCSMSNSNKDTLLVMKMVLERIGIGSRILGPYRDKRNEKWKPMYALYVEKKDIKNFFGIVKPTIKHL